MTTTKGTLRLRLFCKRVLDISSALIGLIVTSPLLIISYIVATGDTKANGFFRQDRVGKNGKIFSVAKLRTMKVGSNISTTVTTDHDPRISRVGMFLRKSNLDELPQLWNVLLGQMSLVGPRPDVPGYAEKLPEGLRDILLVPPGMTGPSTLAFRRESRLLLEVDDPNKFNDEVLYPLKVRINVAYVRSYRFWRDMGFIMQTIFKRPRLVQPFNSVKEVRLFAERWMIDGESEDEDWKRLNRELASRSA